MKNQKHTPGPWQILGPFLKPYPQQGEERHGCLVGPVKENGWQTNIGQIYMNESTSEQTAEFHANARLIAAAPYMLEALETAMHKIDEFWMSIRGVPAGDSFKLLESAQNHMKVAITKARGES